MKKIAVVISLFLVLGILVCLLIPKFLEMTDSSDAIAVSGESVDAGQNGAECEDTFVIMYTPDGKQKEVPLSQVEEHKQKDWYEEPVVVMYQKDGNYEIVPTAQVEQKQEEGLLLEPVAQMVKGNQSQEVASSEVEAYRKDGWQLRSYCVGLPELSEKIESYLQTKAGKHGVYVKNLDTGDFLVLNDGKYHAASVIKLYQMAAIYQEAQRGELTIDADITSYLYDMITLSDNFAFNQLVGILGNWNYRTGFDKVNQYAQSLGYVNTQMLCLLRDAGYFVAYGYNYVSPYECGQTLEQIYRRTLVSPEYSDEMLALLKQQTKRHKIPYSLPENVECANKTGETSTIENDVAIVYSPNCDYIICVMTNDAPSGIWDIREISEMTYQYFNS
ncbi:MAG: serine hydrolase [Clostridia bacterium]|nr:serine hydrolase [Clostridia bacterium]